MYLVSGRDPGRKKNKNRGRLEIIREMLSAASEKTKKTRIMYKAGLSFKLLEKYLNSLLESGLVKCDDDSFYLITWRGKKFLQSYDDYVKQCRRLSEKIRGVRKYKLFLENMCFNNESNSKHARAQITKEEEAFI